MTFSFSYQSLFPSISFKASNPFVAAGSLPTIEAAFPGVVIPKTELQLPVTSISICLVMALVAILLSTTLFSFILLSPDGILLIRF